MVQYVNSSTDNDSFSLTDIFPKFVVNSRGDLKNFDPDQMVESLNKETGLDKDVCIDVVRGALKRITQLGLETIQADTVRELMCVELNVKGFPEARIKYSKLLNRTAVKFKLDETFVLQYQDQQPMWGPLGYITYKRTYARMVPDEERTEEFFETLQRVAEGVFSLQKEHCFKFGLPWDEVKAQSDAQIMFDKMWKFRFLPPGRGLWMMGTEFIEKHGSMALNNCGFCSTQDINVRGTKAFEWLMDSLMLGVGVGFDTKGAGKIEIKAPKDETYVFQVPDSREGWVQAERHLLSAYFEGEAMPIFDFSKVRPKGAPIRGFGGVASGPEPLKDMLESQKKILDNRIGQLITSLDIVDLMNYIGKCVVAGNVRRSAEIALGDVDDLDYVTCKQDKVALYDHRWASNNSVYGYTGMDYSKIVDGIVANGEPGIIWLDNARNYSRMLEGPDYKDIKAAGVNPCVTGDTLIAVADGRTMVPIRQLTEEGKDVPVYCKSPDGLTQIRIMRNFRITGYNQEIYKITLDDGSIIKCTGNHPFILRNMGKKTASQLQSGDSLMLMTKWQTSWDEMMHQHTSIKKKDYWMINTGIKNTFEHTFIFENTNSTKITSGYVIHHRDHDGLNKAISNLEMLMKNDHEELHDISNDRNPMKKWYPNASEEELVRYHQNMSAATSGNNNPRYSGLSNDVLYNEMLNYLNEYQIPLTISAWKVYAQTKGLIYNFNTFRGKISNLIKKANVEKGFDHFNNAALMREYKRYIQYLADCDLELIFDNGIWVIRQCEVCGKEFRVKYAKREQAYCSHDCANKISAISAGEKTKQLGEQRHLNISKQIYELFAKYISKFRLIPTKQQFLQFLDQYGIKDLRTGGLSGSYQEFLNQFAENHNVNLISIKKLRDPAYQKAVATEFFDNGVCFNHSVVEVEKIGVDNVFNGTVDEFHNYGIVLNPKTTSSNKTKLEIIFTANCGEQTLESFELCCLVETFPANHDSFEEYEETLRYAYLYAKTVTLINTHWNETNAVMGKNRRMGVSMTGIIDAFAKHGRHVILDWCKKGYAFLRKLDEEISSFFCIPQSIKLTTVKPSGTVSLLAGASPGIHYPHSEYYIRRIRIAKDSDLIPLLRDANFPIEDDKYSPNSFVVEFPIHEKNFLRSKDDVTIWEQVANAIDLQRYWSDNQVSITVTFRKEEAKHIPYVLQFCEDKLKGISLLPLEEHGYEQAPLEEITKEDYEQRAAAVQPLNLATTRQRGTGTFYCEGEHCLQDIPKEQ